MANVLSLALKVTADASQLKLDPVQRALVGLGDQADKLTAQFDKFSGTSDAAAAAQERFEQQAQELINTLRDGGSATEFAAGFERLTQSVNEQAAAFERAAKITEANLTPLERFDRAQAELNEQVDAGRISQETYARAIEAAAKGLDDAERASRGLAVQQNEIDDAASNTTLKFNELSGIFAALPGPLGDIAGRFSGIASAGEGLARIFSGGLQAGIQGLAASVTALINPFTLAVAGIAAFGAAAVSIAQGLLALDDRVESLGNAADKLGVSFGFIQVLEQAAARSGTSLDAVSAAFGRLQKSVLGVDEESKAAQQALAAIGVTAEELADLAPEEQYRLIGQRLAEIEDPAKRTATATALFGKAGADLIPFFNAFVPAADDLERYGRALTNLDRGRIEGFGDSIDALRVSTHGLGQSLLLPFVGLGDGITRAIAEVVSGLTAIIDPIGRIVEPVFTTIGTLVEGIGIALGTLGRIVGAVFEPFAVLVEAVSQALRPLNEAFLGLVQAVGNGAVSVAEWIASFAPVGSISAVFVGLGETVSRVVTIITTAAQQAASFIGNLASRFGELVAQSPFLQSLGNIISSVFGSVASVFSTIANAIGGTVGRLLTLAENFLGISNSAEQAAASTETLGEGISQLSEEEAKAAQERDKFLQSFTQSVSEAIDASAQFGQAGFDAALQYQNAIADLQDRLDRGLINEETFRREAEAAEAAFNSQLEIAKKAAAEIEANTKRVDELLGKRNEISQAERDINAVASDIARTQSEIEAARARGATEEANRLAARLAQLDQLQQSLIDQSDEAAQGFAEGFDAAFEDIDGGINDLIDKAAEFGNEGAIAASQLTEGIEQAKEAVRDGILNEEAFQAEVERQKQLFEDRVSGLQEAAEITEQLYEKEAALLDKQFEIEKERAEELASIRTGAIQIDDFREGGVDAFFDTLREDPAIGEARKQTKELEKIRQEIAKLNAQRVDILAGVG
jgi:hypothetical protein